MTDREVAIGMLVASAVLGVMAAAFGIAAISLVEGLTVIPATLSAIISLVGALMMAWGAAATFLED